MNNKITLKPAGGDSMMDNTWQMYSLLKQEVKQWQAERGSFWSERLSPAQAPPYYPINELPEEAILELCQRLNRLSNIMLPESELLDAWHRFKTFQLVTNPELLSRLQLALCGVAQLFREMLVATKNNLGDNQVKDYIGLAATQSIGCPICGELAAVSVLSSPIGKRFLHCSTCGHEWLAKRVGCIRCGIQEASKLTYLKSEEYPRIEVVICQACGQYFKEYDLRVRNVEDLDWENIRTLPLDYAAEKWLADHAQLLGKVQ